jgi:hypothetical protein
VTGRAAEGSARDERVPAVGVAVIDMLGVEGRYLRQITSGNNKTTHYGDGASNPHGASPAM